MTGMFRNLLMVLEKESAQYRVLLNILKRERISLTATDFDEISTVAKDKEELLQNLQVTEYERRCLMIKLGEAFSIAPNALTVGKLTVHMPKADGEKMRACSESLSVLVEKIRRINQSNKALLTYSLEFTQNSIRLLQQLIGASGVYQRNGQIGEMGSSGTMLHNEI